MRVILLADVRGSGKKGEIVNVADGYAKNCLFPKKLAKDASTQAVKELNDAKKSLEHKNELEKLEAEKIKETLNEKVIKVMRKGGKDGKLFSAVTNKDVSLEIKSNFGIDIDKHKIHIESGCIKQFGSFKFEVKIFPGISAEMLVTVCEQ